MQNKKLGELKGSSGAAKGKAKKQVRDVSRTKALRKAETQASRRRRRRPQRQQCPRAKHLRPSAAFAVPLGRRQCAQLLKNLPDVS